MRDSGGERSGRMAVCAVRVMALGALREIGLASPQGDAALFGRAGELTLFFAEESLGDEWLLERAERVARSVEAALIEAGMEDVKRNASAMALEGALAEGAAAGARATLSGFGRKGLPDLGRLAEALRRAAEAEGLEGFAVRGVGFGPILAPMHPHKPGGPEEALARSEAKRIGEGLGAPRGKGKASPGL